MKIKLLAIQICLGAALTTAAELTTNVTLVGQLDPFQGNNRYGDVWGEGNLVCVGSFQGLGVGIIDLSNPRSPRLLAHYNPPNVDVEMEDCQIKNRIGFFASNEANGVHIVSLTNPAAPVLLSKITPAINGHLAVHNVFLDGDYLYEADNRTPVVKVFNVSNPSAPVFVRDIRTSDAVNVHDITVVSNRLYASGWGGRTDIYDVSNIGSQVPTLLGTVLTGQASHSSWATVDNRIMATCAERGARDLRLYDVSDPANPVLRSTLTSASLGLDAYGPHNPIIVGHLLFVAWYQAGLQVFDIRDPAQPVRVGAYDTFPGGMAAPGPIGCDGSLCADGNWGVYPLLGLDKVLLSDADGGLLIVDTSAAIPSDMFPFLIVDHVPVFEPGSGTTYADFHVRLSRASEAIVSVDFATANGSAEAGADYEPAAGTLVFQPGETSQPISVVVNGNPTDEPDEYFTIHFSNPTNLILAAQQAVGTIIDNLQPPPGFTSPAFSPTNGYAGAAVTINGTNFTWATRVLFNGVSAPFSHDAGTNYDRRLTTAVPANATTGPITIETPYGDATTLSNFTVLIPPSMAIRTVPGTNHVELSWPSTSGFNLQGTDSLSSPTSWVAPTIISTRLANSIRYVTVTNAVPTRFFRLYRP